MAVAGVLLALGARFALAEAEMSGQLALENPLDDALLESVENPSAPEQVIGLLVALEDLVDHGVGDFELDALFVGWSVGHILSLA